MDMRYLSKIGVVSRGAAPLLPTARPPPSRVPRGSAFQDADRLSVLSYNLLAPIFVRTLDLRTGEPQPFAAFQWAEPASEVLEWSVRWPRLLAEMRDSRADVICLQEVQFEREPNAAGGAFTLPAWLALEGYFAELPAQHSLQQIAERNKRVLDQEVATGNVVLCRRDRLERIDVTDLPSANTRVAACIRGLASGPLSSLGRTVVFSVHLDARSEEKRVEQLCGCLGLVRQAGAREVVIAGDMNTECLAGSCVGAFIEGCTEPSAEDLARECASALRLGAEADCDDDDDGQAAANAGPAEPTEVQLESWMALRKRAEEASREQRVSLDHVWTGATRAGWDHGKVCGPCVSWRLDHIFFTSRTLRLRSCWTALEADQAAEAAGLPNRTCPSDHLPIAAAFEVSPTPQLDEESRQALVARVSVLEEGHAAELDELERRMSEAEPQSGPPAPGGQDEGDGKKKDKGKKKEKPSPEMIAHIQEKRRQLKELKSCQRQAREQFLASLGELELDVFELLTSAGTWVETGARQPRTC